jgi:hypothetical protein
MPERVPFTPYPWPPALDVELERVYRQRERGGVARLARESGRPASVLSRRARDKLALPPLSVKRNDKRLWTPAEDLIVVRHGHRPAWAIQAELRKASASRTLDAIYARRTALKARGQPVGLACEDLTTEDVAEGLGCRSNTVARWIAWGWLKARTESPDARAKRYRIRARDLRAFCREHTAAVARCHPDLIWYTDLIAGGLKTNPHGDSHD